LDSGRALGFASHLREDELEKACRMAVEASGLHSARVRLTVTPGVSQGVPSPPDDGMPTVFVVASSYTSPEDEAYRQGFSAVTVSWRRSSTSPLFRMKAVSYLENMVAHGDALARGAQEALFLSDDGLLLEGSLSNVFLVRRGVLVTPSTDGSILPGVARKDVLGLARDMKMPVEERGVEAAELFEADEAFLTNSLLEIMPLTRVDGRDVSAGAAGELTWRLLEGYRRLVAEVVGADRPPPGG
jgi:branched-subunit amino acid aminotransferase/4-amino-4-deoxychorismate lyase